MEQSSGEIGRVREGSAPRVERAVYERPRLQRRDVLQLVTLVSGTDCVFDPPGSC